MARSIFEVCQELLFTLYLIVVGGKQCVREMRPLSLPFCLLRQPASVAHELLEQRIKRALVARRSLIPALSKARSIRGRSMYKASNSLHEMSTFCSPEQPSAAMVSHNARSCAKHLSYIDLNNRLFNYSYIAYKDQRQHPEDENDRNTQERQIARDPASPSPPPRSRSSPPPPTSPLGLHRSRANLPRCDGTGEGGSDGDGRAEESEESH